MLKRLITFKRFLYVGTLALGIHAAQANNDCKNPSEEVYNPSNQVVAPEYGRTVGVLIEVNTGGNSVPDTRAKCLPIALRYNNIGSIQTPAGGWPHQIGKDRHNTAVFPSVKDGLVAMMIWMQRRSDNGTNTAFAIMSMYAPPDDCIGSLDKLPNGSCPRGFNNTAYYAQEVAAATKVPINDKLVLTGATCTGQKTLRVLVRTIMTYEIGANFCKTKCDVTDGIFLNSIQQVWPMSPTNCSTAYSQTLRK